MKRLILLLGFVLLAARVSHADIKSSNNGPFTLPAAPSAGTATAQSASAHTYGSYVQITASTTEADFITGVCVSASSTQKPTYVNVNIGTGAGGSETTVGQIQVSGWGTSGVTGFVFGACRQIWPAIPVATSTRLATKTASDVASAVSWSISLQMEKQADWVDAGINESANVVNYGGNAVTASTNGIPDVNVVRINNGLTTGNNATLSLAGLSIVAAATNDAVTITGGVASGATNAGRGAVITGGNAVSGAGANSGLEIYGGTGNGTNGGGTGLNVTGGASSSGSTTGGTGFRLFGGTSVGTGSAGTAADFQGGTVISGSGAHALSLTRSGTSGGFDLLLNGSNTISGSLTGSVGSVTGAVGSVTGNVGGNVVGSVASVTNRVTANADQWAGGTIPAPNVTGVPKVDITDINGGETNGNNATLSLAGLSVVASAGNDAVTITGGAASGATPAGSGLKVTGGAASTTSGGIAGRGLYALGGAGAATTNGAGSGVRAEGGGTTTVAGGAGVNAVGTGSAADVNASANGVTGNITGNLSGSVGSVTGAVGSVTGNVGGSVASVTNRVTANTDQLAGQTVTAAAGVTVPASIASPTNITAGTITTVSGNVNGSVGSVTGAVGSVTGAVGSVTAAVTIAHPQGFEKNVAFAHYAFMMYDSSTGAPKPSASPSCAFALDGAVSFTSSVNTPTERAHGEYLIDIDAGELNAVSSAMRCTASGAQDTNVVFYPVQR